jgi:hypothetical protein
VSLRQAKMHQRQAPQQWPGYINDNNRTALHVHSAVYICSDMQCKVNNLAGMLSRMALQLRDVSSEEQKALLRPGTVDFTLLCELMGQSLPSVPPPTSIPNSLQGCPTDAVPAEAAEPAAAAAEPAAAEQHVSPPANTTNNADEEAHVDAAPPRSEEDIQACSMQVSVHPSYFG